MVTLGMDVNGILHTWAIHLHLQHITSREMGCSFVEFLVIKFVGRVDSQNSPEKLILKNF